MHARMHATVQRHLRLDPVSISWGGAKSSRHAGVLAMPFMAVQAPIVQSRSMSQRTTWARAGFVDYFDMAPQRTLVAPHNNCTPACAKVCARHERVVRNRVRHAI